jgi:membrane fusion protein, multidrug efflux system
VVNDRGEQIVYVAQADTTAERRVVELGFQDDSNAEILSGIAVGDRVVVKGQRSLKHGAAIKILDGDGAAQAAGDTSAGVGDS